MDRINEIWPKWHTEEPLGQGAYGRVFKVRREELGEVFYSAVKVIRIPQDAGEVREMISDGMTSQSIQSYYQSIVKGLMNEIRVLETLKSAGNVVNIEEFEVREREDGIGWEVYIRMELLENLDLYRRNHLMGLRETAKLGLDISSALDYCEKSRIIHRDIKPSNLFVDGYGNFKLGDFGIARQMEKTQSTLSRKGTEMYMAPELGFGESGSSYNVDIYSLGLVMYRLLNRNRMPFEPLPSEKETLFPRDKENALLRRIQKESFPAPADADEELGQIILKASEPDKTRRYQHAREMHRDLENWFRKREAENGFRAEEESRKVFLQEAAEAAGAPGPSGAQDRDFQEEKTVSVFMERQEQPKQASEPDITPGFQFHSRTEPGEGEKNGTGDSRKKKPWWALGIAALFIVALVVCFVSRTGVPSEKEAQATLQEIGLDEGLFTELPLTGTQEEIEDWLAAAGYDCNESDDGITFTAGDWHGRIHNRYLTIVWNSAEAGEADRATFNALFGYFKHGDYEEIYAEESEDYYSFGDETNNYTIQYNSEYGSLSVSRQGIPEIDTFSVDILPQVIAECPVSSLEETCQWLDENGYPYTETETSGVEIPAFGEEYIDINFYEDFTSTYFYIPASNTQDVFETCVSQMEEYLGTSGSWDDLADGEKWSMEWKGRTISIDYTTSYKAVSIDFSQE
ncbi:serine/threonine protein kinase [Faecalicatena fissicatena]|uniref:Serine/threonine protein kinase n=1 Tax=Faecalicatena fissicatena TaxID=290055 RepID=A0ABS2EAW7_9FIRM|nr:serine/threonine-protein kinase [Faecalicatena fissicatena]MBM6738784.1 serine/threonine protein kinase [Faecalicatena fissicatena]